jgi:lyso-ornithine lipid O-acyltransferase
VLRAPVRLIAVAGVSGALYVARRAERRGRDLSPERHDAYMRTWGRLALGALGIRVSSDPPPPSPTLPRLVVSNHRSTIDIPILHRLFGGHLLSRADVADWPVMGALAREAGTLLVDRDDTGSRAGAVLRIRERLRGGHTVCVFPEGTTFYGDEVRPFQAGAFAAVAREKGEVLPVGIAYDGDDAIFGDETMRVHLERLLRTRTIRAAVAIGSPIPCTGLGVTRLCDRAHADVQSLVHQARAKLSSHGAALR